MFKKPSPSMVSVLLFSLMPYIPYIITLSTSAKMRLLPSNVRSTTPPLMEIPEILPGIKDPPVDRGMVTLESTRWAVTPTPTEIAGAGT